MKFPEWVKKYIGEYQTAEYDPYSGKPVSWGWPIITIISEEYFESLREECDVVCIYPDWFIIDKKVQFSELMMEHGAVRAVGIGPGGGFKWVRFDDDTVWGHPDFKFGALRQKEANPRTTVKCDKYGEIQKEKRKPHVAVGRPSKQMNVRKHGSKRRR